MGLAALPLMASCSTPSPGNRFPEQTWDHKPDIRLLVSRIVVERVYQDRSVPPHVETQAPKSPAAAAEAWARQRLAAVGSGGTARVIITDGRVVQKELSSADSSFGLFSGGPRREFDGTLQVLPRLDVLAQRHVGIADGQSDLGLDLGLLEVEAMVTRRAAFDAGVNLNERERLLYRMVEEMTLDLDKEMEAQIRRHLGAVLAG